MKYVVSNYLCLIISWRRNVLKDIEGLMAFFLNKLILSVSFLCNSSIFCSSRITNPINNLIRSTLGSLSGKYLNVKLVRMLMKNLVAHSLNLIRRTISLLLKRMMHLK